MRAWSSARFTIDLPPGHRFPIAKYGIIRDRAVACGAFEAADIHEPDRADRWALELVHTRAYVDAVAQGSMAPPAIRRLGFPWSEQLRERSLRTVQGTVEAARDALELGAGVNLAGGTHHAFADRGEGFCVFNDVAIAIRVLQQEGRVRRAAIVDLDVHQGNGTARIFEGDPDVYTFSMHAAGNFPFHKERSSLDVELADGASDPTFLSLLAAHLDQVLSEAQPELVFYLAGADPYREDRFGRLALSFDGLRARDTFVLECCRRRGLPIVITMAGGYARSLDDVALIHTNTLLALRRTYG
jgi:acetoin utilization deacetylase AcuC-like enzyme